jgi:hypothetical protein
MKRILGGLIFGAGSIAIWIGCGGSSTDAPGGGADSGTPPTVPPPNDGPPPPPPPTPPNPPPADASKDVGDDVTIDAPEITLQYGSCPLFASCGGDPTGTWKYSAGCVDEITAPGCPTATVTSPSFKVKGIVTFGPGSAVSRQIQAKLGATIGVPKTCVDALPAGLRNCATIQFGLTQPPPTGAGFDSATCNTDGVGGCSCDIAKTQTDVRTGTYTLTNGGNTITTDDGRKYDFCVGSDAATPVLRYRDSTPNNPTPATFELAH